MSRLSSLTVCAVAFGLVLGAPRSAAAEDVTQYQEIEISWPSAAESERLGDIPGLEIMGIVEGESMRLLSTVDKTAAVENAGLTPTIIHDDLQAHYALRNGAQRGGGDYGLLYTWDEVLAELDALHAEFPSITTDKISIGTTVEGRDIWSMKISDNPTVEEAGEPEVLFDAMHHARESITVVVLLTYMRYLCENYGIDSEATYIVDNRQTWFVPIVNPDGFLYNQQIQPAGGGLWRKNRRNNPGSCEGVDLNRNYSFEFGGPGSSGDMCQDIYRGPSAFSEPETSALRDLMIAHEFVTHNSYHSVVGTILYPWGYTATNPPDVSVFADAAIEMARDSGYTHGTAGGSLYLAAGVTVDYAYGNTTDKPKILSFTTEVGGSGFWPQDSEVAGLVAENIYSNVYLSLIAGSFVQLESASVSGGDGNGQLDAGETADIVVAVENAGVLAAATDITVSITSADPYVSLIDAAATVGDLAAGATGDNGGNPFVVTVDAATPDGHVFAFDVQLMWDGGEASETAQLVVGSPDTILFTDFEAGAAGWSADPASSASSGTWIRIDPNPTAYQPGDDTTVDPGVLAMITGQNVSEGSNDVDGGVAGLLSPVLDLTGYTSVEMQANMFFGQRDVGDDASDFFRIDLSNDGGASFPANVLTIGDIASSATWQPLSVRLDDFLPLTSQMVVRLQASDGPSTGDIIEAGLDDVGFVAGDGNDAPSAPVALSPADGATVPADAELVVTNAIDPNGDALTYTFTVYSDAALTTVVRTETGIVEGAGDTSWMISPALADGEYHWRTYAEDAALRGLYSEARSFVVGDVVGVPSVTPTVTFAAPTPNPFRAATTLGFVLAEAAPVRADVFDVSGRHLRSLYRGILPEGPQTMVWDGLDRSGRAVSNGQYFMQVVVDGEVFTRKVIAID